LVLLNYGTGKQDSPHLKRNPESYSNDTNKAAEVRNCRNTARNLITAKLKAAATVRGGNAHDKVFIPCGLPNRKTLLMELKQANDKACSAQLWQGDRLQALVPKFIGNSNVNARKTHNSTLL
jgi:hypothetical protein